MSLKVLYWNYRGAESQRFYSILNDLAKIYSVDLLFIVKCKISGIRAKDTIKNLKMQCVEIVEAEGRFGGLWMLTQNNRFSYQVIRMD